MSGNAVAPIAAYSLMHDCWLEQIFEQPVWRVQAGEKGRSLHILESSENTFAYAKFDVRRISEVSSLCDLGFRIIDTSLVLEGKISAGSISDSMEVRFAQRSDRGAVREIAGRAFRFSRFHLDPRIPVNLADKIKVCWADNYFDGNRGDGMVVAESHGKIVGFLQLLWGQANTLIIDLIGIVPEFQRQGLGRAMIIYAANHGTGDHRRPAAVLVGTQAANTPSMQLYEGLGLRLRSAQYVLHFHSDATRVFHENRKF